MQLSGLCDYTKTLSNQAVNTSLRHFLPGSLPYKIDNVLNLSNGKVVASPLLLPFVVLFRIFAAFILLRLFYKSNITH
jgi:hypothetical protein